MGERRQLSPWQRRQNSVPNFSESALGIHVYIVRMYMYRFLEFPCVVLDYVKLKYTSDGCHGYPNIQQSRHWTPFKIQCVSLIIHVCDSLDRSDLVNCLDLI